MRPPGPNPAQIAAMQKQFAAEAAKRGMTPEQFSNMQRQQLAADAAKNGMTPEQYINQLKARAIQQRQQQAQQQAQQQGQQPGQQQGQPQGQAQVAKPGPQQQQHTVPVNSGAPPNPKAVAVAQFLRSQDLKTRTCILDGQRKDMFKGMETWIRLSQSHLTHLVPYSETCPTSSSVTRICQSFLKTKVPTPASQG